MPLKPLIVGVALLVCHAATAQTQGPIHISLPDAMERAQKYSQQVLTANIAALLAREDIVQARAALLPTVNGVSQFIYTQPNGTTSGVFVPNDGPHLYTDLAQVHADVFAPAKRADYRRAMAAEAVARAKADLAARGLIATVLQDYYGVVLASRKLNNADLSLKDAQRFLDLTDKQEKAGEVAQADTVKARLQVIDRQRNLQEAQLAVEKARVTMAVLIFPDFRSDFDVTDDLEAPAPLPDYPQIQALAGKSNPDVRAALATVQQQNFEIRAAHLQMLPTFSVDYFFGLSANQFAAHNPEGNNLIGSSLQAQVSIPIWNWGSARSKVRQAELKLQQAKNDLSFTQRQLLASIEGFYREATVASAQLTSLRETIQLSQRSLDLTVLRYQAGEATALEVADAQNTARDARNALDDGLLRYRVAIANLQTLTGAF